jgi:MtN3 and saliva related transmembrane protein
MVLPAAFIRGRAELNFGYGWRGVVGANPARSAGKQRLARKSQIMSMSTTQITEGLGFVAAACTTLAFVPQLFKIRKQGGRDVSYGMLWLYLCGLGLWLVYGVRMHAMAIIAANVVGIVLAAATIAVKRTAERPRRIPAPQIVFPEQYVCDNPLGMFPAYPPAEKEKVQALAYAARRS